MIRANIWTVKSTESQTYTCHGQKNVFDNWKNSYWVRSGQDLRTRCWCICSKKKLDYWFWISFSMNTQKDTMKTHHLQHTLRKLKFVFAYLSSVCWSLMCFESPFLVRYRFGQFVQPCSSASGWILIWSRNRSTMIPESDNVLHLIISLGNTLSVCLQLTTHCTHFWFLRIMIFDRVFRKIFIRQGFFAIDRFITINRNYWRGWRYQRFRCGSFNSSLLHFTLFLSFYSQSFVTHIFVFDIRRLAFQVIPNGCTRWIHFCVLFFFVFFFNTVDKDEFRMLVLRIVT